MTAGYAYKWELIRQQDREKQNREISTGAGIIHLVSSLFTTLVSRFARRESTAVRRRRPTIDYDFDRSGKKNKTEIKPASCIRRKIRGETFGIARPHGGVRVSKNMACCWPGYLRQRRTLYRSFKSSTLYHARGLPCYLWDKQIFIYGVNFFFLSSAAFFILFFRYLRGCPRGRFPIAGGYPPSPSTPPPLPPEAFTKNNILIGPSAH